MLFPASASLTSLLSAATILGAVISPDGKFIQATYIKINTLDEDAPLVLESAITSAAESEPVVSIKCAAIGNPKPTLSWQFTDWTNTNTMDLSG